MSRSRLPRPHSPPPADTWFRATAAVLVVGAALRLWQYAGNPSLWIDEIALARSVVELPVGALITSPLYFNQTAPIGFLLLEKLAIAIGGASEPVLRAIPLLAGLASLPLFIALARRVLRSPAAVFFAAAAFALGPRLVLRSAEVKQYSTDVLIAIVIALAAVAWLEQPTRARARMLGLVIGAGVWFSHAAVIVGAAVLVALALARESRTPIGRRQLLVHGLPALASVALAALVARRQLTPEGREYLLTFWRGGFIPWEPGRALVWVRDQLSQPLRVNMRVDADVARLYLALVPIGWVILGRQALGVAAVVAAPVLATLAGAALRQYPFADRLVLFLSPLILLTIAAVVGQLHAGALRLHRVGGVLAIATALAPIAIPAVRHLPVIRRQEARSALEWLAARRQRGEPVYVYFAGWQALSWYGPRVGLDPDGVFVGQCAVGRADGYRADLEQFAGVDRLWVFVTHERETDRSIILRELEQMGAIEDSLIIPTSPPSAGPGASVHAVDLSRLRAGEPGAAARAGNPACHPAAPEFPVDSLVRGGQLLARSPP